MAAIVREAREIMREQGVAALNLSEIARRLGMQTPSLYEYFPGKMALYDHLFGLGMRLFREQMAQVNPDADLSEWQSAERYMTAYLQFAIDNPELFKLVFERHVPGFVPSEASMAEASAALAEGTRSLEAILVSSQRHTGLTVEQTRDIFLALMHGIAALHLANQPDQPAGQGRFGSLIPYVVDMLEKSWSKESR